MKVRLKYYGMLAEHCQTEHEERQLRETTVGALRSALEEEYWILRTTPYHVARGTKLCGDDIAIADGDELALLPPFAGG